MPKYDSQYYTSYQRTRPNPFIMDRLTMLSQREQLMEDIDSIVETFCWEMWEGKYPETQEELTRILRDAVCRNFPAN
jgi:hypothetical protein